METSTNRRLAYMPCPLPHQLSVLTHPARNKVVACGRRWGKTALGLMATVMGHGQNRGQPGYHLGAIDGAKIGWFAPIVGTRLEELWRELKRATVHCTKSKSDVEKRIQLTSGGEIICRSLHDPNNARGPGWDGIVIDEAAFVKEEAWTEVLRPALADRQGWAIFVSTPNGNNWFKQLYDRAGTEEGWASWQGPSSQNTTILPEELEAWKREVGPRAYAQEFDAQFMEVAGALFPASYFPDTIWFDAWPDSVQFTTMALDPSMGKSDKADYSAWVVLRLDPTTGIMYVDADLERRPPSEIVMRGVGLATKYAPQRIDIEANAFQAILASQFEDQQRKSGMALPIYTVIQRAKKEVRITGTLDYYLSAGLLRFRRTRGCRLLVEQLQTFPEGKYDDGPDALQMAIEGMKGVMYPMIDEAATAC